MSVANVGSLIKIQSVQSRLAEENRSLAMERSYLADLMNNVQKMHNDLERSGENDRRRLEGQLQMFENQKYVVNLIISDHTFNNLKVRISEPSYFKNENPSDISLCRKISSSRSFRLALRKMYVSFHHIFIAIYSNGRFPRFKNSRKHGSRLLKLKQAGSTWKKGSKTLLGS